MLGRRWIGIGQGVSTSQFLSIYIDKRAAGRFGDRQGIGQSIDYILKPKSFIRLQSVLGLIVAFFGKNLCT